MKIYEIDELTDSERIDFPYIEHQQIDGADFLFKMNSYRSEDWYGYKGWLRKLKDLDRAKKILYNTHNGIHNRISKGDVVFDCGANEGYTTILMSQWTGINGMVVAFEPDPNNVQILKENLLLNNIHNVIVVNKAIISESGKSVLFSSEMISNSGIVVGTVKLDDYAYYKPDFIKIDVEGYELPVLQGATEILKSCKYFEIEMHLSNTTGVNMKKLGFSPDTIYKILFDNGYDITYNGKEVRFGDEVGGCIYCKKLLR